MVNLAAKHVVGAHYGLRDWLVQRITAIVMIAWTVLFLGALLWNGGFDHASWRTLWAGNRISASRPSLFVVAVLWHAWVGVRNIAMDYLKSVGLRLTLQCAVIAALVVYLGWTIQILWGGRVNLPVHRFDAIIVGAGGAGMRASLQLAEAGLSRRGAVEGVPDALAHGRGAGRHRRLARQHERGQLAVAHVRHDQGLRLARRPGRDRGTCAGWRRRSSTSSSTSACRSTATRTARSTSARSAGIRRTSARRRCSARARRPTAPGTRCCTRSTSATCARTRSSSSNGWRSTWCATPRATCWASSRSRWRPARSRSCRPRPRCSRPAARDASSPRRPTRSSTRATGSAWPRARASRSRTWSSGSSTRPASPARAC